GCSGFSVPHPRRAPDHTVERSRRGSAAMAPDRRGTCGASAAEGFITRCMRRLADVHDPLLAARPDLQAARHVLTAQDGEAAVVRVGAGAELAGAWRDGLRRVVVQSPRPDGPS